MGLEVPSLPSRPDLFSVVGMYLVGISRILLAVSIAPDHWADWVQHILEDLTARLSSLERHDLFSHR